MTKDWKSILAILKELDKDQKWMKRSLANLCKEWTDDNLAIFKADCARFNEDYRTLLALQSKDD